MKSCEDYQELISRLIDGELSADEQADVERHIRTCPDCAALYEAFRSLSGALAGDLAEPPAALRENVMAELRRDKLRVIGRRRRVIGAFAACLAIVILASVAAPRLLRAGSAAPSSAASTAAARADMAAGAAELAPEAPEPFPGADCAEEESCDAGTSNTAALFSAEDAAQDNAADGPVYVLDEEQSLVFLSWLFQSREEAARADEGAPPERLQVVFVDGGEQREATLFLYGEEIRFTMADGSASGRLYCSTEELFALLG